MLRVSLCLCALAAASCACKNRPAIDPTGQRIFTPQPAPCFTSEPGTMGHCHDARVVVAPGRIVAPVGTEVVMLAGVVGQEGYLQANERVEWMLAPNGVGHIVTTRSAEALDWLFPVHHLPHKVDNSFAIATTSRRYVTLTRGTPALDDDVRVLRGQSWITVSSPTEGTSYVTAYARDVYGWNERQQTGLIHWVDAQWTFPPPGINPLGTRHVFTTTVSRNSDQLPIAGWPVRYEIADGPAAGFAPDGQPTVEVLTDSLGRAAAEIFQRDPAAGTNRIRIQVIRPAVAGSSLTAPIVLGTGATQKTWTAPELSLNITGPAQATVGATLSYRVEVVNGAALTARQVAVTISPLEGLGFATSVPPGESSAAGVRWLLGDLRGGERRTIDVDFRADRAATFQVCASASAAEGSAAQDCVATSVFAGAAPTLDVRISGPATAVVGQDATFQVIVTNRGDQPATGILVTDRFEDGFQHSVSQSPIERDLEDIAPNTSREFAVTFRVTRPGQICHDVEVSSSAGMRASARACVTATAPGTPPAAAPPAGPAPQPAAPPPPASTAPAEPAARPAVSINKQGPRSLAVGETAEFTVTITNTGTGALNNLTLTDNYDRTLDPVAATDGYQFAGEDIFWKVDTLPPGRTILFQVNCTCVAPAARACNRATVTTQEGARADAEACLEIRQPPPANLQFSVTDLNDPVAIGGETTYLIRVRNAGATPTRQATLVVTLPDELVPIETGTRGPTRHQIDRQTVRFDSVAEIRAGETLEFNIRARAGRAGNVRVRAELTSPDLAAPQVQETTTTIFTER